MRGRAPAVAGLLLAAGCGITPTNVVDVTGPPTVRIPPPSKTIYLLKPEPRQDSRSERFLLTKEPADVENDTVDSLLTALFQANDRQLGGLHTALRGFTYEGTQDSLNPVTRDETRLPRTSKLTVYIKGKGTLSKLGKAQIVCTAQQDASFEQVKIIRQFPSSPPREEGEYTCGDLKLPTS
ncbi:hypothetical protein [Nonomuraea typhae]|uniref:hypothetical protein n=1 Tax=Nonomuraea typhae TaxID=2603600 RepID=UPI0012F7C858|nr:hypothetical protein [Nonomuraea typhae]